MQPKRNVNDLLAEYAQELGEDFNDDEPDVNQQNLFDDDPELKKLQQQLQDFYLFLKYRFCQGKQKDWECSIVKQCL